MEELIDKLKDIQTEKDTKIIPGNIKAGVTVLGVTGELSPEDPEYDTNLALSENILGGDALYTPLQYIQSSGTQYIDLNFRGDLNATTLVFQVVTAFVAHGASDYSLHGTGNWYLGWRKSDTQVVFGAASTYLTSITGDTAPHTFYLNCLQGKYGYDTQSWTFTAREKAVENPMLLFGWQSDMLFSAKVYECYIYNGYESDGTTLHLVRHLIPVKRNSDDEVCMYDTVSATFFTNQGTGSFIAGPAKTN